MLHENKYHKLRLCYNPTTILREFPKLLIQLQSLKRFHQIFICWLNRVNFFWSTLFKCTRGQLDFPTYLGPIVFFDFMALKGVEKMIWPSLRTTLRFQRSIQLAKLINICKIELVVCTFYEYDVGDLLFQEPCSSPYRNNS